VPGVPVTSDVFSASCHEIGNGASTAYGATCPLPPGGASEMALDMLGEQFRDHTRARDKSFRINAPEAPRQGSPRRFASRCNHCREGHTLDNTLLSRKPAPSALKPLFSAR
jgi:hypothetical protein